MNHIPLHAYDLIDDLNEAYPEKAPDPEDSEREIWMKAGERRLINRLLVIKQREEDEGTQSDVYV